MNDKQKQGRKFLFLFIIAVILILFATICVIYATIMQSILSYEKFGVIFNSETIFIPHESAWWYLGGLAYIPARILIELW